MFPLRDHEPSSRFPTITIGIIALNAFVFLVELTTPDLDAFVWRWSVIPAQVDVFLPASLLTFITAQFLHGGFVHILSNMWYLWIFGDNVEGHFGHARFLGFYLLAGVAAGALQFAFTVGSDLPMLGASGAIAGVLGAYLALFPHHRVDAVMPMGFFYQRTTLPASGVLLFWFVIQLFNGTASIVGGAMDMGGVAWWAHIGGFAFGWIVAKSWRVHDKIPSPAERG